MNAKVVYQVVKALPREEQRVLFDMLQKEFQFNQNKLKKFNTPVLTKEDAIKYLLNNVFNKKQL